MQTFNSPFAFLMFGYMAGFLFAAALYVAVIFVSVRLIEPFLPD